MMGQAGDEKRWASVPGERLDVFVGRQLGIPRLKARAWIVAGCVTVAGAPSKPSHRLAAGEEVRFAPPPLRAAEAEPEDLPIGVVHEDADLVVIDKPAGMATHPGPGWWHGSAVNALLQHCGGWKGIGGVATPGIVHRLDRDTSGLLVFAKGEATHRQLLEEVAAGRMLRSYLALVEGRIPGPGVIALPLGRDPEDRERVRVTSGGKAAVTHFTPLAEAPGPRTWLELRLRTGRTHQIRVHLAHLGYPVMGDPRYGRPGQERPMALHARELAFIHPVTGAWLRFTSAPIGWESYGPLPANVAQRS